MNWTLSFCVGVTTIVIIPANAAADADDVSYLRDIKPILKSKCWSCHGSLKQEAGLRLDTAQFLKAGGDSGSPVDESEPGQTLLLQRIAATDEDERMPPEGEPVSPEQIARIRQWIANGALGPSNETPQANPATHWAFQPVQHVSPPTAGHPIDAFIDQRLATAGLHRSPPADAVTVVRRMFLDLHGLPPTPEQITEWSQRLSDSADFQNAIRSLTDKLLDSPRYGERWAQHWLDVVRYADTHGYEVNTPRPNAWPYRDYVIEAFHQDKPYDQFVFEQLAGDTTGADAATGLMVAAAALLPGQIGKDEESKRLARQDELDEIIIGTNATFLGLTVGCARCHDHKFDPIPQSDYYAMQAFFAGVDYGERPLPDPTFEQRKAEADALQPKIDATEPKSPERTQLTKRQAELRKPTMVFAGRFHKPNATFVLNRGNPEQPTSQIAPHVLTAVGNLALPDDASDRERRTSLANWIASPQNPLTARVMVNRIWQAHFGIGFVETASDFGLNGALPSHPRLLDWLADEFVSNNWSMKHLQRLILSSKTWQQASTAASGTATGVDADNRLLWRFPSRRLEAESIRDGMLQVSGQLNLTMGGPGFDFFKSRGGLSGFPPVEEFPTNGLRRMIYAHKIRMERVPVFGAFDCPDAGLPTPLRSQSTTAIQALNLFNSPFVLQQANAFADRVESEVGNDVNKQIDRACRLALGRSPTTAEQSAMQPVVGKYGLSTLCRALFNSSEFLFLP